MPPRHSTSTQPAVSQHISPSRDALGMRVLERSARGVALTPAGEVLVRHASALLDAARRAEEAVHEAGGVGRAQVRVGAFPSAAAGLLPAATRELRARRPDAEMTLQVLEEDPALDALLAGRIDMATIVQSPLSPSKPRPALSTSRSPPTRCRSRSPPTTRWPRTRRSRSRSCARSRG